MGGTTRCFHPLQLSQLHQASNRVRRLDLAVPPFDFLWLAGWRADVARGRTDESPGVLLLQNVRAPARGARTGEHRREHVGWHLGEVEDDGRPELNIGGKHTIGFALSKDLQRRAFELLSDFVARGAESPSGPSQYAGAWVLCSVDAVAEAHQPLSGVQHVAYVALGVPAALDFFEHVQHTRRRTAVQRSRHRA